MRAVPHGGREVGRQSRPKGPKGRYEVNETKRATAAAARAAEKLYEGWNQYDRIGGFRPDGATVIDAEFAPLVEACEKLADVSRERCSRLEVNLDGPAIRQVLAALREIRGTDVA